MRGAIAFACLAAATAGACGDDGGSKVVDAAQHQDGKPLDAKLPDAFVFMDAPTNVVTVACPTTPDATVTIDGLNEVYVPTETTITVGKIVQFTTQSIHDVSPDPGACTGCIADPGIHVDFDKTECKKFLVAASYGFECSFHGFKGHVVVNP